MKMRDNFSETDRINDATAFANLQKMAWDYIASDRNYKKLKEKEGVC